MSGTTEESVTSFSLPHQSTPQTTAAALRTLLVLVIRPSLGSNWKLLWQILAKKYTSLSTSSEINHARLTTVTAGIILWSRTTVRRNNSSLVSVLSLHRAGRSNLVERILPFFFSFHFVILPFAEAIDGSIKILSACNGQARADPKRQSTRLSWEKVLPR